MSVSSDALAAFVLSAELGSFSAAARRLGKRQSTISETIANLEIDLGLSLFERGGRQPQLSVAGLGVLPAARQMLAAQDALQHQARLLAGGQEVRLTLVLSDTFHSGDFESVLSLFEQRFPTVELECLVGEQEDVLALIGSGRAQLGLMTALPAYPADMAVCTLARPTQTALYVSAGHALAGREQVDEAELRKHRELRLKTYAEQGAAAQPGHCWSAPSYLLLLEMAQHGFGWAELPGWLVARYGQDLQALPVSGWPRRQRIDAVWSRQRPLGLAAAWVLQVFREGEPA